MKATTKILLVASITATMLFLLSFPALGNAFSDQLGSALQKAKAGKYLESFEKVKDAELTLWRMMPEMTVRRVVLVTEEPSFFGAYIPRADNRYKHDETLMIYVEPIGYTIKETGDIYSFTLMADIALLDDKGKVLGGQRDFGRWEMGSRRVVTDYMIYIPYNLAGLTVGNYVIEALIKDTNSGRTVKISTPIKIVE